MNFSPINTYFFNYKNKQEPTNNETQKKDAEKNIIEKKSEKGKKLKIGVMGEKGSPEWSACKPTYSGIMVDIWEETAKRYNLDFEYICFDGTYDEAIIELNKNLDVMLSSFSVVNRRLPYVDFTRPVQIDNMYFFKQNKTSTFFRVLRNRFIIGFLIFAVILLMFYTFMYKYYEKKTFLFSFYYVILNLLSDEKEIIPSKYTKKNNLMVFLDILWIFLRFTFFAIIITQLINIIIKLQKKTITDEEIKNIYSVNTIRGAAHVDFVKTLQKNPVLNEKTDEFVEKMINSNEDVYAFEVLAEIDRLSKKYNIDFMLSEHPVYNDESSIAVNKKDPELLNQINNVILDWRFNNTIGNLCEKYLGSRIYCSV